MHDTSVSSVEGNREETTADADAVSRRGIVATLLGITGLALLNGCQESEPTELARSTAALTGATNVRWYDTHTELRSVVGGTTTSSVNVAIGRGYAAHNDGGGGLFIWTTDTTTADDDWKVIVPGGTRTGCWKRLFELSINVRWFGAKGDGTSDDTAAIQTAINKAKLGGAVVFPAGTYRVTAGLSVTGARNLTLRGTGAGSAIQFQSVLDGISGSNVQGLAIEDLALGGTSGRAIAILGNANEPCIRVRVRRCVVSGATMATASPATAACWLEWVKDSLVEDCTMTGNGAGADNSHSSICIILRSCINGRVLHNRCYANPVTMGIGAEGSTDVVIQANYIDGALSKTDRSGWGYGIYFYEIAATRDNLCLDNHIHNTEGTGIYVQASPFTAVRGNVVENSCSQVTGVTLATGGIAINPLSSDCIVAENIVRTTGQGRPGIRFDAPRTQVVNNNISETSGDGIYLSVAPSHSIVSGNSVVNSARNGIASDSAGLFATNITISGNTVDTTGNRLSGIAIGGNPINSSYVSNVVISSNTVRAASGAGIVVYLATRFAVTDNIVSDSSQGNVGVYSGIYIGLASDGIVSGNISCNSSGTSPQLNGVQLNTSATIELRNNNVRGHATGVSLVATTAVTRSGNRCTTGPLQGSATLAGVVTAISTSEVQSATDTILVTRVAAAGTLGHLSVANRVAGTGFDIVSVAGDVSTVYWEIVH